MKTIALVFANTCIGYFSRCCNAKMMILCLKLALPNCDYFRDLVLNLGADDNFLGADKYGVIHDEVTKSSDSLPAIDSNIILTDDDLSAKILTAESTGLLVILEVQGVYKLLLQFQKFNKILFFLGMFIHFILFTLEILFLKFF